MSSSVRLEIPDSSAPFEFLLEARILDGEFPNVLLVEIQLETQLFVVLPQAGNAVAKIICVSWRCRCGSPLTRCALQEVVDERLASVIHEAAFT